MTNREVESVRRTYEKKFYHLLMRVQPKKPELGVRVLMKKVEDLTRTTSLSFEQACARVYQEVSQRVERRLKLLESCPTGSRKLAR